MITTAEMSELEERAVKSGITKLDLMENAGREVARIVQEKADIKNKRLLIACYHGNNGGDGFVAARYLADKAEVDVLFLGQESRFKPEAEKNFREIEENPLIQFTSLDYVDFDDYDVVIDAILGTGIEGMLSPHLQAAIAGINNAKGLKISVDIPSGLDPNTGNSEDTAVDADLIITFHDIKTGLLKFKDKTVVVDIGIPR